MILDSSADEAKSTERIDRLTGIIKDGGGEMQDVQKWGRRKLAYEINRRRDGVYFMLRYAAEAPVLKELEHRMRLDDLVLRHMTVLAEEDEPVPEVKVAGAAETAGAAAVGAAETAGAAETPGAAAETPAASETAAAPAAPVAAETAPEEPAGA